MDKLSFLDAPGADEPNVAPAAEPAHEPASEPSTGPSRGPDGKFVAKESDAAPAEPASPEPPPAQQAAPAAEPPAAQPPESSRPEPGHVPIPVLLDERDKRQAADAARKAAEQRAEAAERRLQEIEQQNREPPPPPPDPISDPDGYAAHQANQLEERLFSERANFSERFARKEFGDDVVTSAQQWAAQRQNTDPAFSQRIRAEADPYAFVVAEYRRDQIASSVQPSDWDAFQQWKASQSAPAAQVPQAATPPPTPQPPAPPRSLAAAPSAGGAKPGEQPVGPGIAFGSTFK